MIRGNITPRRGGNKYILPFLLFFLSIWLSLSVTSKSKREEVTSALEFLNRMQSNCSSPLYTLVGFGGGGGFASQFQEAASEWIRAASSLNYAGTSIRHHLLKA